MKHKVAKGKRTREVRSSHRMYYRYVTDVDHLAKITDDHPAATCSKSGVSESLPQQEGEAHERDGGGIDNSSRTAQ